MLLKESDILDLNISSSFCKCKPVCVSDTNNGSASAVCVTSVSAVCVTATQTMGQPVPCVSRQSVQCVSQQHKQWVSQCGVSQRHSGSASAMCITATQWSASAVTQRHNGSANAACVKATQEMDQPVRCVCVCLTDTDNGSTPHLPPE